MAFGAKTSSGCFLQLKLLDCLLKKRLTNEVDGHPGPYPHPPPLRTRRASDCEIVHNTCSDRLPINQNPLQGHLRSYSMEALNIRKANMQRRC